MSFLGKWCWRLLVEKDGLWYRILKDMYGEEGGRIQEGGQNASAWWRMMCYVREGVGLGVGNWFDDNIKRVVGNGRNTFFWTDNWLGEVPLKLQFSRLYELSVHKVYGGGDGEMGKMGECVGVEETFVGMGGG